MTADAANTAPSGVLATALLGLSDERIRTALSHPSWAATHGSSYERLEFLGDAVLQLAVTQHLYADHPELPEGDLSRMRALIVSRDACAEIARAENFGELMRKFAPESTPQVEVERLTHNERVLAAVTESVIGACFLDLGYSATAELVVTSFASRIQRACEDPGNAKSVLQELLQADGRLVEYRVVAADGPPHDRAFTVEASVVGEGVMTAQGTGNSKKAAEVAAARVLLERLNGDR